MWSASVIVKRLTTCFFFVMMLPPPRSTLFPYTTLFRSGQCNGRPGGTAVSGAEHTVRAGGENLARTKRDGPGDRGASTRPIHASVSRDIQSGVGGGEQVIRVPGVYLEIVKSYTDKWSGAECGPCGTTVRA